MLMRDFHLGNEIDICGIFQHFQHLWIVFEFLIFFLLFFKFMVIKIKKKLNHQIT